MLSPRFGIEALLHDRARPGDRKASHADRREARTAPLTSSRTKRAQTAQERRRPLARR
jgi:hypothetical protein